MLIVELGCVNNRGEIAWSKIAKALGISIETLRRWRMESSGYYQPDFASMLDEIVPKVELGQVKRAFIERSKPHAVVKITRELRRRGPERPPQSMRKGLLVRYAKEVLGLSLPERMREDVMRYEIDKAIRAQSTEELVVTKRETQRNMGDNTAGAMVAANYGPPEERWRNREVREHEAGDEIKDFMDWCRGRAGSDDDGAENPS